MKHFKIMINLICLRFIFSFCFKPYENKYFNFRIAEMVSTINRK